MSTPTRLRRCALGLSWAVAVLLMAQAGCGPSSDSDKPSGGESSNEAKPPDSPPLLRLAVIDDEPLADAIVRRWTTETGGQIELRHIHCTAPATLDAAAIESAVTADAIIYPAGLLGEFAERDAIVPLPQQLLRDSTLARRDVFDLTRQQEAAWGETVYAVPFGSPQLTLYYRPDVFQRLGLKAPETWEEYQQAAEKLASDAAPLSTLEPLAPGWAGQLLLARAASYARHRSQYSTLFNYTTMAPLIAGAPFVRALEELAAVAKLPGGQITRRSPHEVREQFWAGRAGMALTWPTGAPTGAPAGATESTNAPTFPVAFAELPGSPEAYNIRSGEWEAKPDGESPRTVLLGVSGRLGSVTRRSRHSAAAFNLLARISGDEWSGQLAPVSSETTLYRNKHLQALGKWVEEAMPPESAKAYAEVAARQQTSTSWLSSPQIPGRGEYLAALDEAVWSVVEGDQSPQAALEAAGEEWRQITDRVGLEKQQKAYERSLGLEP